MNERKVEQNTESQIRAAIPNVLTNGDRQMSIMNILGLVSAATAMGIYQGFASARGLPTPWYTNAATALPVLLMGAYVSYGEPSNGSDIERISESRVEVIDLGEHSKLERLVAAGCGVLAGSMNVGMGYGIGYAVGSLVDKFS